MKQLTSRSKNILSKIFQGIILPEEKLSEGDTIELSIKFESEHINIREMAAYLEVLDHFYGRMRPKGIRSYAQLRKDQLKIKTAKSGSIEIIFSDIIINFESIDLLLIYILLKPLKSLIIIPTTMLSDVASAYNNYESGRLKRARRKLIKAAIEQDETLSKIPVKMKPKVIQFLDHFYKLESPKIAAAARFAGKYVKNIYIRIKKQK